MSGQDIPVMLAVPDVAVTLTAPDLPVAMDAWAELLASIATGAAAA